MAKWNRRWMSKQRGFDSAWEDKLNQGVMKDCHYHPDKIQYTIEKKYEPDWVYKKGDKTIYIEAKGRFRDMEEAAKYKWVRMSLKSNEELVFLFMKPQLALPHARPRKDGTKRTHAEWAEAQDFRWFSEESITDFLSQYK